jgi:rod shape-determining protein MreD
MLDRIVQAVFFVPQTLAPRPPLGQVLMNVIATVAAYPLVVLAARWLVGLRRAPPGNLAATGI